jgi:tetratricopeptide (TPR) repeat protein
VKANGGTVLDPTRDQYLLDFGAGGLEAKAVQALPAPTAPAPAKSLAAPAVRRDHEADQWFQRGLQAEQTGQSDKKAEEAYRRCLETDPKHASALVNLGTIYFNRRKLTEADRCYRRAVDADPHYPLAHFNLANLHDERGELEKAREHYEMALELNPKYADAHYNLALLLQSQGEALRAISHWRTYLKLDPQSSWSAIARRELERMKNLTVLPGGSSSGSGAGA